MKQTATQAAAPTSALELYFALQNICIESSTIAPEQIQHLIAQWHQQNPTPFNGHFQLLTSNKEHMHTGDAVLKKAVETECMLIDQITPHIPVTVTDMIAVALHAFSLADILNDAYDRLMQVSIALHHLGINQTLSTEQIQLVGHIFAIEAFGSNLPPIDALNAKISLLEQLARTTNFQT